MSEAPLPKWLLSKWLLALYLVIAVFAGTNVVVKLVRGEGFYVIAFVGFVAFAGLAVDTWWRRRKV